MSSDLLTIGMATYGEFDSVWFTLTGLTANHPRVRYLVVDNTPERDPRTEAITRASGGTYLHRPDLSGTSKPRDAVFRYAQTPWVMCIDSHVILESGAVAAALEYAHNHPASLDLVQGPMVYDDGRGYSTHWNQPAVPGLWGTWDRDPRAEQPELFEIPMMGLGLWMMRREAWPGFNPLFRGFGGEEGYAHESVRRRGGKCFCLPALRWRHKFRDVSGWNKNPAPPYPLRLEDHVWNLLVGHRELGIDALPQIHDHFGKRLDKATWDRLVAESETQPFGGPRPEVERQKILALWYSDNTAPASLLKRSAMTVGWTREEIQNHFRPFFDRLHAAAHPSVEHVRHGFRDSYRYTFNHFDGDLARQLLSIAREGFSVVWCVVLFQFPRVIPWADEYQRLQLDCRRTHRNGKAPPERGTEANFSREANRSQRRQRRQGSGSSPRRSPSPRCVSGRARHWQLRFRAASAPG